MSNTSYMIFAIDEKDHLWNGGLYESEYFMKERVSFLKKHYPEYKWRITEIRPMAMKEDIYSLDSPNGDFYADNII